MEAPIITVPPKAEHKAAEGRDTQLRCLVFGSPRPLVVWKKGSEQLTGGRFTVTEQGHLNISVRHRYEADVEYTMNIRYGTFEVLLIRVWLIRQPVQLVSLPNVWREGIMH